MKGAELPINVLIILALAVIVLIAVLLMFYTPFSTGSSTVSLDTAKSQACHSLISGYGCSTTVDLKLIAVYNYNADDDANGNMNTLQDNLQALCEHKYQIPATDTAACRKLCGCSA
jgi:hypothetical protein